MKKQAVSVHGEPLWTVIMMSGRRFRAAGNDGEDIRNAFNEDAALLDQENPDTSDYDRVVQVRRVFV